MESVNQRRIEKERLWPTVLCAIASSGPSLVVGCTLGFPSAVLLDLNLDSKQSDLFGVSVIYGCRVAR